MLAVAVAVVVYLSLSIKSSDDTCRIATRACVQIEIPWAKYEVTVKDGEIPTTVTFTNDEVSTTADAVPSASLPTTLT